MYCKRIPERARFVISHCNRNGEFTIEYLTSSDKVNSSRDSNDRNNR